MSVQLNDKSVRVTCACGNCFSVHICDWNQDEPEVYDTSDDQMGSQVCHRFTIDEWECSQCHKGVNAQIEVWEYPSGMKEYTGATANVDANDAEAAVTIRPE